MQAGRFFSSFGESSRISVFFSQVPINSTFTIFFFFLITFAFQLTRRFYDQRSSGQAVVQVSSLFPLGARLRFLWRIGSIIPTAHIFTECC